MEIKFVKRQVVVDSILDKMNRGEKLTKDDREFLEREAQNKSVKQ